MDTSPGPDKLYLRLLRASKKKFAGALMKIVASSQSTDVVPEDWRVSNIVPLFKKGTTESPGNDKPVSPTSVAGKLLEMILLAMNDSRLEVNGLIRTVSMALYRAHHVLPT